MILQGMFQENVRKRLAIRGGNWYYGLNCGPFALNLNDMRSNSNTNVGFRLAFAKWLVLDGQGCQSFFSKREISPSPMKGKISFNFCAASSVSERGAGKNQ